MLPLQLEGYSVPAALGQRPLLAPDRARGLASLFRLLANDSRLRLLHALARAGELSVTALAQRVGMKPQAVSNQLQRLSDLGVLASRRAGNHIFYRLTDCCVPLLLEFGLCVLEQHQTPSR